MFKNIKIYFNKIKSVLPNNLKNKLFFLYLALLVSAILEMVSLGSIPVFISFLVDRDSNFNILGVDLGVNIKNLFPSSEVYIILPIIIIFIYLFKSLYLFFVLYIEQKLVKEIKLFFVFY